MNFSLEANPGQPARARRAAPDSGPTARGAPKSAATVTGAERWTDGPPDEGQGPERAGFSQGSGRGAGALTPSSASAPGSGAPSRWSRQGRNPPRCGRSPSLCSRRSGGCARPRTLHTPATCRRHTVSLAGHRRGARCPLGVRAGPSRTLSGPAPAPPPHLLPPGCTSSPHHSQPAERETEAGRGTLPCPRPRSSSHPSQILPLVQSAVRQAPPLNGQGGRGGDPGGSRRFIVGAEPGPPLLLGSVLTVSTCPQTHTCHHKGITIVPSVYRGSAARPPPHFGPPHLPTMCGHQSF